MFRKAKVNTLKYKASQLPSFATKECPLPALTAGIQNQGLNNYVPIEGATILKNVITISANGANTGATFYQTKEFTVLQDSYAIEWIDQSVNLSDNDYLFIVGAISKAIYGTYEWTNKAGWERIKGNKIKLPMKNNIIDFDFMNSFVAELEALRVAELEAYLNTTGLKNYSLTKDEQNAISDFEKVEWKSFNLEYLFGKSTRGKRLKSDDRIPGNLPFITAGEAEEGVSDFIGNNVTIFNENTTTIDMFGSAKYRGFKYGGDDHIAVVHTEGLKKYAAIFVTSSIHKSSHNGQFSYDKNFYAKDADVLNIMLPSKNGKPDFDYMSLLIEALHKLIIKEVVEFSDSKIKAIKTII